MIEYTTPTAIDQNPETDITSSLGNPTHRWKNVYAKNFYGSGIYVAYTSPFIFNEVPTGLINSSNTAYTLSQAPSNNSLELYWNGMYMSNPDDYTIAGLNITMGFAPVTNSKLIANYQPSGVPILSNFSFNEVPVGLINGINSTYTVSNSPINTSAQIFLNSVYQISPDDYTIAGSTFIFVNPPVVGSKLKINYQF
jgi:hypothetical protein